MARVVLNTFGSFGDLHPYLALAIELQRRGHECVLATSAVYRTKITGEGIGFAQVRPDVGELINQPQLLKKLWDPRAGQRYLLRDYLMSTVEQSFTDLDRACVGADLLLTHAVAYGGPLVAAARKLPWLSVALQPAIFFSHHDPAVLAVAPWTRHIHKAVPWTFGATMRLADKQTRAWAKPVFALRKRLGLNDDSNPIMQGQFSPLGTLTLFSASFAQPQPDWPPHAQPTGFVFYDKRGEFLNLVPESAGLSEPLRRFLAAGPPPVLFTLGSSAVTSPGTFYTESAAAAKRLGVRAVLLVGQHAVPVSDLIYAEEYVSYSALMPHVAAVVHQGGIGTVAQTLRAGKPMLVVRWAHDQPDNGYRLERLGVARVLPRGRYTARNAVPHLSKLLSKEEAYGERARAMAAAIGREDGLSAACNRIQNVLDTLLAH
jgi:rhamnosyltransferase subunit B